MALLLSCSEITVKNTRVCTAAGFISAGADCAYTRSEQTDSMTFDEFLTFLEPQPEVVDPKTHERIPARSGAMCQSAEDWNANIQALQQACLQLGDGCSKELKDQLDQGAQKSAALQKGTK